MLRGRQADTPPFFVGQRARIGWYNVHHATALVEATRYDRGAIIFSEALFALEKILLNWFGADRKRNQMNKPMT